MSIIVNLYFLHFLLFLRANQIFKRLFTDRHSIQNTRRNMSHAEMVEIRTISNNKSITIKPLDKGRDIAIINKTDYINECNRQLHNKKILHIVNRHSPDRERKKMSVSYKRLEKVLRIVCISQTFMPRYSQS